MSASRSRRTTAATPEPVDPAVFLALLTPVSPSSADTVAGSLDAFAQSIADAGAELTTVTPDSRARGRAAATGSSRDLLAASSPLSSMLDAFGITGEDTQDTVALTVTAWSARNRVEARVVSVRYGVLTLASSPQGVALLRPDAARLVELLADVAPGVVRDVRFRADRPARATRSRSDA